VIDPRFAAAVIGTWVKGLGATNVVWGTDSLFHARRSGRSRPCADSNPRGHAEEARLRRSAGQRATKNQILGLNSARLYNLGLRADYRRMTEDKFAQTKEEIGWRHTGHAA